MSKRLFLASAAAILLLGGVAMWLVSGSREPSTAAGPGGPAATPAAPGAPAPLPGPVEIEQRSRLEEARGHYFNLKTAYDGGRPLERSGQRVSAALRRLWPGGSPRWTAECRARVCRITAEGAGPTDFWGAAVQGSPDVAAVADRVGWDPDGKDPGVYVLLAQEGAEPGAPILEGVERQLRASPEVAGCLREAAEAGAIELDLEIDDSGIVYRRGATLDSKTQGCVEDQLSAIIGATPVPQSVKAQKLRVVLRSAR